MAKELYGECQKNHATLGGKTDGCQQFRPGGGGKSCDNCYCSMYYHRKVKPPEPPVRYKTEVVYTKCHKIHEFNKCTRLSVDGCQEFIPGGKEGTAGAINCVVGGCHKGFHRNEITRQVT